MANVELVTGTQIHVGRGAFTRRRLVFGYSLLAPAVLYMVLLVGVPFLFSLYLSLSDASVDAPVARFIGLQNFFAIFQDSVSRLALRNTVLITVIAAVFKGVLGTLLAFLLMQEVRGKKLIRSLIVIPWTLPVAISALAWKWMFDPQFSAINWVAVHLHLMRGWPIWLGEPGLALTSVIIVNVWRGFPFTAIVLLAGFSAVPLELIDAGKVDGASYWQRYTAIVIPIIAPILFVGLLFDTVFTLSDLSVVYLLTAGGPMGATEILPTRALEIGIQAGALGRGAAISLVLFPILLPVVYVLLRILKRREGL
ncbi:MAG TPA: sugar ABC transporter permease [bacterium]|nr:sugar ABC transporter permease [bacterium]